ncbi:MAG: TraR/DksA C4-type zinc finger protein [bacterium]
MKKKLKKKNPLKVKKNLSTSKTNKATLKIKKTKLLAKVKTKKVKNIKKRSKPALIKKSKLVSKIKKAVKSKSMMVKSKAKKSKIVKKISPKTTKIKKTAVKITVKKATKPVLLKKAPSKTKLKLLKPPLKVKPTSSKIQKEIISKDKKALTPSKMPTVKKVKKSPVKVFDEKELQYIRNILLKRKTDLESRLTKLEEKFRHTQQEDSGDASSHPLHIGDIASDTETKEQNSYMISSIVKELRKIHGALDRLASGNYGICEACGESIDVNRLRAIPYAEFCIKCGEKSQLF